MAAVPISRRPIETHAEKKKIIHIIELFHHFYALANLC